MLQIAVRKTIHNRRMFAVLLLASIAAVATICSIPLYTDGILQKMLRYDLEELQTSQSTFPGRCYARFDFGHPGNPVGDFPIYHAVHREINDILVPQLALPVLTQAHQLSVGHLFFSPNGLPQGDVAPGIAKVESLSSMKDHVRITHGRMFSAEEDDGVYEVIVTEGAMKDLGLVLDRVYLFREKRQAEEVRFRVKVVGTFTAKDERDPFWFSHFGAYDESMFMDYSLLTRDFVEKQSPFLKTSQWFYALDYHSIRIKDTTPVMSVIDRYARTAKRYHVTWDVAFEPVLKKYELRARALRTTLWFLQIPTLCMLAMFIYLTSLTIVENERNEIAVLKSRGAANTQVFLLHLMESLLLGGIALVVGPPLGLFISKAIGSANGFLEFIQREALPVSFDTGVYVYALTGVLLFITTMLIPVVAASRRTIVQYKRGPARSTHARFPTSALIDICLILVALYGLYRYHHRLATLDVTGVEGGSLPLDPLLFLASFLFMLGTALFFQRLFPHGIRVLFLLGKKRWSPILFASLVHVGRSSRQGKTLMVFLMLSLSLGIYNSMAARTINTSVEDQIRYANGADITIDGEWQTISVGGGSGDDFLYVEPDFRPYTELEGVEMATKVQRRSRATAVMPDGKTTLVQIMGIIPHEFGEVAWFRRDLLPHHWYEYLNLLSDNPKGFLVSESLRREHGLVEGDWISLAWSNQGSLDGYACAFVEYWPSFDPPPGLIVANLQYIQSTMFTEPYQVWLKKDRKATDSQISEDIERKELRIAGVRFSSRQITDRKNDPLLQGTNGALTVGFLIIMLATIVGFIVYLLFSFKSRLLQFGVFRAMGLSQGQVNRLFAYEQLLVSGTAIIMGVLIGNLTGRLFIPIFQVVSDSVGYALPFRMVALRSDFLRLYLIVAGMLAMGAVVFRVFVSRIRISQVLKLGEE